MLRVYFVSETAQVELRSGPSVSPWIEAARGQKLVGASLEAKAVVFTPDAAFAARLRARMPELQQLCIVSEARAYTRPLFSST